MNRLLVLVLAVLAGCASSRASAPAGAPPPTAPPAAVVGPAPDGSLGADAYVALGFPATDRAWSPFDHGTAGGVLAAVEFLKLPRRGSPRSGAVFARMTDRRAYGMVEDTSIPLQSRLQVVVAGLQGNGALLKRYAAAHLAGQGSFAAECFDLTCLGLHATRRMAWLVSTVPVPSEGDPARGPYDRSLGQVRGGLAQVIQGAIVTLGERTYPADRLRLAGCLEEELPGAIPELSAQGKVEARGQVRRAAAAEKDPDVKRRLDLLARTLDAPPPR